MDPEQTFLRVHARLSGVLARLLTPRFRTVLEYICLLNAVLLLGLLLIMHVNFVGQPGCAKIFSSPESQDAQVVQIKITDSWSRITEEALTGRMWQRLQYTNERSSAGSSRPHDHYQDPDVVGESWNVVAAKFWLKLTGTRRSPTLKRNVKVGKADGSMQEKPLSGGVTSEEIEQGIGSYDTARGDPTLAAPDRGPLGTALLHYIGRWSSYITALIKRTEQALRSFWQLWGGRKKLGRFGATERRELERRRERIAGWEPVSVEGDSDIPALNPPDALSENRSRLFEPTYLYSAEKGYLMLSDAAKHRSNVRKVNLSISAQDRCFGNRWQQLLIDNFVGYDTILMNSLLNAKGNGYLYNYQTKELYNLNYLQDFSGVPHGFDDFIVFKCGVLITSLFVFFTTTMSVSFTLRETQSRMLKFTVQLQHHARHRLPTYRLIFVHVVESLIFVPIMIGILFFLFEFFDDQLLAFMVLTLVWLCELFTMISVRTPHSMQYFPRFFFLYFMVFHIYFFSYTYGFSYLAFSVTGAFMQHLVLYFWNRFEVPALQAYLRRRALLQQHGLQISSAILTSTVQVARLSTLSSAGGNTQAGVHHWIRPTANESSGGSATQSTGVDQGSDTRRENVGTQGDGRRVETEGGNVGGSSNSSRGNDILVGSDVGTNMGVERSYDIRAAIENLSRGSGGPLPAPPPTFSPIGAVLPWFLGGQAGGLISLLPIFRESREAMYNHPPGATRQEQVPWDRAGTSEDGLRHRHGHETEGNAS